MPIVGGLDIHRKQLTFDYLDTETGEVKRGPVAPADRAHLRARPARFARPDGRAFALGDGALRTGKDLAAVRAAAAAHLSPAGQLQVAVALEVLEALDARMHQVRHQLLSAARHLTGAKVLAARLYGVGPVTALAMTCWLAGKDRFSSARKAVRFAGLDITVWSSDRKGPPGRLSRQGPPVLRWAVYEAGKTHARSSAPDHRYYAQVKDRQDGKRAALSEARKLLRQACHILAELGDDALSAA